MSYILHCQPFRVSNMVILFLQIDRSSHLRCSVRQSVPRNFAKFTGKHLCQSLFFNKVVDLRPVTLLKEKTLAHLFSCKFCKISKNTFNPYRFIYLFINGMYVVSSDGILQCHRNMLQRGCCFDLCLKSKGEQAVVST